MQLSERQEKILHSLIKEYINTAEPISSNLLKERGRLDVSPATIRNELQELTEQGYITQPHTSAGRVPTQKGYRYFIEITFTQTSEIPDFISKEIETAREKIDRELKLAQVLMESLIEISSTLRVTKIENKENIVEVLEILSSSKTTYHKNIDLMEELIKKLGYF